MDFGEIYEEVQQDKQSSLVSGMYEYRRWEICFCKLPRRNWTQIYNSETMLNQLRMFFFNTALFTKAWRVAVVLLNCAFFIPQLITIWYNERLTSWQHLRLSLNYFLLFCILLPCVSVLLMSLNIISPPFWHLNCCYLIQEIGFPHRCST